MSVQSLSLTSPKLLLPPLEMDAILLLHTPSMAKRPCCSPTSDQSSLSAAAAKAPATTRVPNEHSDIDAMLESFLSLSDSSSSSINRSFDRLIESTPCDSDQDVMIERALRLGSILLEAGKRSARKRSSVHNSVIWPLPPDLTIKIFTMLDTQSVCHVAAACSFFQKCAVDPLCFSNIDLTTVVPKVNNAVVSTMIQRAGNTLQSIKLGVVPGPTASYCSSQPLVYSIRNSTDASGISWNDKRSRQGKESAILTRSCLASLSGDGGAPGARLRRLHLYNIERMDNTALAAALLACPYLLDLEIVGLHVELRHTLESVSKHCPLLERLVFESSKTGRDDGLKFPTCNELVQNCPNISSLALRGFKLHDYKARMLVKGFRKLKYVDFSTCYTFTGAFLKSLGGSGGGNLLEILILRDCMHLKEVEVERFMAAVLAGEFNHLRHLDISNREGLASEGDWYHRCYSASFIPIKQLLEQRPDFCLVAEFPEGSFIDVEQMIDSDLNSDISLPCQLSSHNSDGSHFMSTSDSSYNSDQGSGNEESQENSYVIYEESSDEVGYLSV